MRKDSINFSGATALKNSFEEVIYSQIPLTKCMGVQLDSYNGNMISVKAPLDKNINHRFSAFGGSIYSVAVLAGYGLILLRLRELDLNPHIVIHKSSVTYIAPIEEDFTAVCKLGDENEFQSFLKNYLAKKKSRIELNVEIISNGKIAFKLNAKFVIYD